MTSTGKATQNRLRGIRISESHPAAFCRFTSHQKALINDAAEGDRRMQREADSIFSSDGPGNMEVLFLHGHPSKVLTSNLMSLLRFTFLRRQQEEYSVAFCKSLGFIVQIEHKRKNILRKSKHVDQWHSHHRWSLTNLPHSFQYVVPMSMTLGLAKVKS